MRETSWLIHNLVGHPIAGVLWFVGARTELEDIETLGDWVHDLTLPADAQMSAMADASDLAAGDLG